MLQVFEDWNKGELDSFLIEITKDILKFKDSDGEYSTSCCTYSTLRSIFGYPENMMSTLEGGRGCQFLVAACEAVKGDDIVKLN